MYEGDICSHTNYSIAGYGQVLLNPACEDSDDSLASLDHYDEYVSLYGDCVGDWVAVGQGCYQFIMLENSVDQVMAEVMCRERGGHLVEIDNDKESQDIIKYYTRHVLHKPRHSFLHSFLSHLVNIDTTPTGWWTGARYNNSSGAWVWGSSGARLEFDNWHDFNKHKEDSENCAVIYDDSENTFYQSFGWVSLPCSGSATQDILTLPLCEK